MFWFSIFWNFLNCLNFSKFSEFLKFSESSEFSELYIYISEFSKFSELYFLKFLNFLNFLNFLIFFLTFFVVCTFLRYINSHNLPAWYSEHFLTGTFFLYKLASWNLYFSRKEPFFTVSISYRNWHLANGLFSFFFQTVSSQ